jgi:DNA-binding transcriptional LysR family regulator
MRLIDVVSPLPLGYYPLSIGVVPSSSLPVAYGLIRTFLGNQGGTNVSVSHAGHADLEKGLAEARFDFGFTDRPPERKDLDSQLVVSTELNFYVAAGKGPSGERLADLLAELPLLISTPTTSTRGLVEHYLEEAGIAPRAIIRSDYPSLTLDLCRNGHGVGVFTEEAITSAYGSRDGLREVKGGPRISERLYVVWPKGSENSAALQALRALLR